MFLARDEIAMLSVQSLGQWPASAARAKEDELV